MKGITPVIALILLIIIVIALVGFSFTFFSDVQILAQETTEEEFASETEEMTKCLVIDNAASDIFYIRNCGLGTLSNFVVTTEGMIVPILNPGIEIPENTVGPLQCNMDMLEIREYRFYVSSGIAGDYVDYTPMGAPDTTPPEITGLTATETETSVNILWYTDEPANSTVTISGFSSLSDSTLRITHSFEFIGLTSQTTYDYDVGSSDFSGNTATQSEQFTTRAISNDLMLYMPLDGDFLDYSGNDNHGSSTSYPEFIAGYIGQGANFSKHDHINCGSSATLDTPEGITVAAWVYYEGGESWPRITEKYPAPSILIIESNSTVNWYGEIGGVQVDVSFDPVPLNDWTHVAVTYQNDTEHTIKVYFDGTLVGSDPTYSGQLAVTANDLYIGNRDDLIRTFFGILDDIRIYNRSLSQGEIQAII